MIHNQALLLFGECAFYNTILSNACIKKVLQIRIQNKKIWYKRLRNESITKSIKSSNILMFIWLSTNKRLLYINTNNSTIANTNIRSIKYTNSNTC